jgi:hypothetical protein
MDYLDYIERNTLRKQVSSRGGGIEICLQELYPKVHKMEEGAKMTAYQNYLGGGLLGRVCNDCTIKDWTQNSVLNELAEALAQYYHNLTNPDSEWESRTFEQNQNMPESGY